MLPLQLTIFYPSRCSIASSIIVRMILLILLLSALVSSSFTLTVPFTSPILKLPSNSPALHLPPLNETNHLALPGTKSITPFIPSNGTANDESDWPPCPITRFLGNSNYFVITLLGTRAPSSQKTEILSHIDTIVQSISLEGSPLDLIDMPYIRNSGILTVEFSCGPFSVMTREEVICVMGAVWELTRMYTAREILKSNFGIGHSSIVSFNMTFFFEPES